MYSCYSILERCNLFSGVKLGIRSFCLIVSEIVFTQVRSNQNTSGTETFGHEFNSQLLLEDVTYTEI